MEKIYVGIGSVNASAPAQFSIYSKHFIYNPFVSPDTYNIFIYKILENKKAQMKIQQMALAIAGSMVMAPSIGEDFVRWRPPAGGDGALGLVEFAIFPHLDHEDMPGNSMADAERWAAAMPVPAYAIDDQTAIKVTNTSVEVVSEGHWRLFGA